MVAKGQKYNIPNFLNCSLKLPQNATFLSFHTCSLSGAQIYQFSQQIMSKKKGMDHSMLATIHSRLYMIASVSVC